MLPSPPSITVPGPVGGLDTLVVSPDGPPRGVAVVCHPNPTQGGTHGNKVVQTCAKALASRGYVAYCPNLRGVGKSDGEHDYGHGEVDDVLAVAGFARAQFPGVPLILAGFSFGGFVAAHARQRTEADGLILMGPAVGRYPVPMPAEVPADTLVIHGEEDEVIALSTVLDWARPQSLPVVVFPGTTHFFHGKLVPLGRLIARHVG
ncbi:alpha/beta hydrolase [Laribacter hongkongensis]|uniref:alpha/beta hydrolase n=1 Tax=Laribacter hongkongensis TaxID=168471 RepID=UPI001EFE9DFD|nr:alpha/beta fold hydrolase [Laribacter hongkongensis]MCG9081888.1 alpha/beta fold hydrolase [Laribacter hongkongensis]